MKLRWMKHPVTHEPDMMATISMIVVIVCSIKFLFEGVEVNFYGHSLSLGRADSMTYAALLGPVLGAHGWKENLIRRPMQGAVKGTTKVDNPDA